MIYILQGSPTLRTDDGEDVLAPGMCAGFPAGGSAHQLINRTDAPVIYLEIGDRTPGDEVPIRKMISKPCWLMVRGPSPTKTAHPIADRRASVFLPA